MREARGQHGYHLDNRDRVRCGYNRASSLTGSEQTIRIPFSQRCSALWEPSLRRLSARLSAGTAQIRGLDLLAQQWGR